MSNTQNILKIITIILLVGAVSAAIYWLTSNYNSSSAPRSLTIGNKSPSPSPAIRQFVAPLPTGQQIYTFSSGSQVKGPKVTKLTIDPLDVIPRGKQTLTLEATNTTPITSVEVELITDTNTVLYPLTLQSSSNTQGIWTKEWSVNDTIENRYGLRLILKSKEGTYDNTMWFRQ